MERVRALPRPPDIILLDYMLDSPMTGRRLVGGGMSFIPARRTAAARVSPARCDARAFALQMLGTDLIKPLRNAGCRGIICMRTAMDSDDAQAMYMAEGADGMVSKTCGKEELKAKLSQLYNESPRPGRLSWEDAPRAPRPSPTAGSPAPAESPTTPATGLQLDFVTLTI